MWKIVWGLVCVCVVLVGMWGILGVVYVYFLVLFYGLIDVFVGEMYVLGVVGSVWQVGLGGMMMLYWGVMGLEDFGYGMKVVFMLEGFFRVNVGQFGLFNGQLFFGCNVFVGLSGCFGEVMIGCNMVFLFVFMLFFNLFGNLFVFLLMILYGYLGLVMGVVFV